MRSEDGVPQGKDVFCILVPTGQLSMGRSVSFGYAKGVPGTGRSGLCIWHSC